MDALEGRKINIKKVTRSKKKCWTVIEEDGSGCSEEDMRALCKKLKKQVCNCGGSVIDKDGSRIIQLQGNQVKKVSDYFIDAKLFPREGVLCHG